MNFAQLTENLRIECGVSGSPIISVQNVNGELARLKMWISDAWNELQASRADWKFLRANYSFTTQAGKQQYSLADAGVTNLDVWKQDSAWMYDAELGVSDQMPLGQMPWEHFRDMYIRGVQNAQRPMCYSINPDKTFWTGPLPDDAYTISGEYWTVPVPLVLDADTPVMPERFHKVIVYNAMKKYAGFESATEVMARAMTESTTLRNKLEIDQLPPITIDGGW